MSSYRESFLKGAKDGIPIALGYLAVSFSLGIAMRTAGISSLQGFFLSLLNLASAGEYAGLQVILTNGSYFEIALVTLVANARYLLMSTALSQRFGSQTRFLHRLGVAFGITDELFGAAIAREGDVDPVCYYGSLIPSAFFWALGTSLGITAGSVLPARIVSALSVALYGMFIAIIIPPSRKDKAVAVCVIAGFFFSWLFSVIPFLSVITGGTRVILLTVVIASAAAVLKPLQEDSYDA